MSELAYDADGDRFEVPAMAAGWRVRRFRNAGARGAPEVVFGEDGRPLVLPIEAGIDELRGAVAGVPGRYRLDPVDPNGRAVEKVPAAYLQFGDATRSPGVGPAGAVSAADPMLGEVVRANADMVKVIAEKFAGVMEAAATLLKAADGAGLPARPPVAPLDAARNGGAHDDDDETEPEARPRNATAEVLESISSVMDSARPYATLAATLFGGRAGARNSAAAPPVDAPARPAPAARPQPPAAAPEASTPPPNDPAALMRRVEEVKARLTPEEQVVVHAAVTEMTFDEVQSWMAKLGAMSVDEAVAEVRRLVGAARAEGES